MTWVQKGRNQLFGHPWHLEIQSHSRWNLPKRSFRKQYQNGRNRSGTVRDDGSNDLFRDRRTGYLRDYTELSRYSEVPQYPCRLQDRR